MNQVNIMIDLETLSTRPNSAILTIGAIAFSNSNPEISNFYRKIDSQSCLDIGMVQSEDTVEWWKKQNEKAREEAFGPENRVNIKDALQDFITWVGTLTPSISNVYVWSNGSCFDCVILDDAFIRCELKTPWKYFNVRDTRTIYSIAGITHLQMGKPDHTAIGDCRRQIAALLTAFERIRVIKN